MTDDSTKTSEDTTPPEGDGNQQDNNTGQAEADQDGGEGSDGRDSDAGEPEKPKTLAELLKGLDPEQQRIVQGEVSRARGEAKNLRERLKIAEPKAAEYDKGVEAQKSELQREREQGEALRQQLTSARIQTAKSKVEALAAGTFADPDDAIAARDWSEFIGEDGTVDTDAIRTELDDLLARKPHWAKSPESKARPPAPNRAQGSSANGAETIAQQIADAKSKGDLKRAIALENTKLHT